MCWSTATPLTALPEHQQRFVLLFTRLAGPVNAERAGCGQTPTCRIRFWCSGGGPPSGDVLLEEAIFMSRSEPPPLERLPSGLLDILPRAGCCWRRRCQWRSFCRCKVDFCAGLRIHTARRGPGSFCGFRDTLCSNVTKAIRLLFLQAVKVKGALPSFRDAPGVLL